MNMKNVKSYEEKILENNNINEYYGGHYDIIPIIDNIINILVEKKSKISETSIFDKVDSITLEFITGILTGTDIDTLIDAYKEQIKYI